MVHTALLVFATQSAILQVKSLSIESIVKSSSTVVIVMPGSSPAEGRVVAVIKGSRTLKGTTVTFKLKEGIEGAFSGIRAKSVVFCNKAPNETSYSLFRGGAGYIDISAKSLPMHLQKSGTKVVAVYRSFEFPRELLPASATQTDLVQVPMQNILDCINKLAKNGK